MLTALFRGFVSQSIWIVEPVGRKLVERRIWIWRSFVIYRQFEDAFPNANLRKTRERCGKQKEQHELPSHRFHLKRIDSHLHVETTVQLLLLSRKKYSAESLHFPTVNRVETFFQTAEKRQLPNGGQLLSPVEKRSYRPGCNSGVTMSSGTSSPLTEPCQTPPPKVVM